MVLILALLLVLLFFGLGFAVHLLWIAAVVLLVLWVVGFRAGSWRGAGSAPLLPVVATPGRAEAEPSRCGDPPPPGPAEPSVRVPKDTMRRGAPDFPPRLPGISPA